ncbi:MAG TPA: hypothetical protein DCZ72_04600 [Armatimonadetes bacterium]|nr:hypothetical protein [Armatimonadota bacterium]
MVHEFIPTRPIARMEVFAMLRRASGTVWFDELEVCRAPLDWLEFDPRLGLYGGQSLSLDALLSRPAAWSDRL